jgi:hypothetical protein
MDPSKLEHFGTRLYRQNPVCGLGKLADFEFGVFPSSICLTEAAPVLGKSPQLAGKISHLDRLVLAHYAYISANYSYASRLLG